jgi:glycosyltransferase involved in cell wall biosynthesis
LIVTDNCSSDNTEDVVRPYLADARVRYFRNSTNIGAIGNWKMGVYVHAQADWFLIMSDDDYFVDDAYLQKACALIHANPDIGLVYAGSYLDDEESGTRITLVPPFKGVTSGKQVFISRGTVQPQDCALCNIIYNKSKAEALGFLKNEENVSSDSEVFLQLCLLGDVAVIPEPVTVYRFHAGNLTKRILTSARLLEGNLDYLLNPYISAKRILTVEELETFKRNTKLYRTIAGTLLRLMVYKTSVYREALARLKVKLPEELAAITQSPAFITKMILVRLGRPVLRRRMPMTD